MANARCRILQDPGKGMGTPPRSVAGSIPRFRPRCGQGPPDVVEKIRPLAERHRRSLGPVENPLEKRVSGET